MLKRHRYGISPSYFVSWTGDLGPKKITKDTLTRIYQSGAVGIERN